MTFDFDTFFHRNLGNSSLYVTSKEDIKNLFDCAMRVLGFNESNGEVFANEKDAKSSDIFTFYYPPSRCVLSSSTRGAVTTGPRPGPSSTSRARTSRS